MEKIRLQKVIAQAGIASRRKAETLISEGHVTVNGEVVTTLGTQVSLEDDICVSGKKIDLEPKYYFLFHKPLAVLSASEDLSEKTLIIDYFRHIPARLFAVGRLDYNTSGAIIITNDGELSNLMMHPSSHLDKTYEVSIDLPFDDASKTKMEQGLMLSDGLTAPCHVFIVNPYVIHLTIHEGRNRQVRRMFSALGYTVKALKRIQIGPLELQDIPVGKYRSLTDEEVISIKTMCQNQRATNKYKKIKNIG